MSGKDALEYVQGRSWPVFPCHWRDERRKQPLTERGFLDASRDPAVITAWWHRWPEALIGVPTGRASGFVVLDVDVKGAANGFDTLADLGFAILPDTAMVHTASGGLHIYFDPSEHDIPCTTGAKGRGIGPGLDWRGKGGYVIAPSPGSGYSWDPHWTLASVAQFAPIPDALLPHEPEQRSPAQPIERTSGLSPYAEAALKGACDAIVTAPAGEQERTITSECFSIGTLAAAGGIPVEFTWRTLRAAATRVRDYDPRRPWRAAEIEKKVARAFNAGLQHPRAVGHG